jgi:coenzyme F420-reducing hydrogenase delta subunit
MVKSCITLVFDGFMIPKENVKDVNMDDLLKELEQEVLNELGYQIKLVVKPMNNIIDIPDDYKEESNEGLKIIKNDEEGADSVLSLLNNCIYRCENIIYFKDDNVWIDNYKTIENLLKKFIMEQSFVKHVKATKEDIKEGCSTISILGVDYCEHKYEYYSSDTKGTTNILSALISKIPINNNLLERILFSSKNKIFFDYGYYDFKQRKFIDNFDNVETLIKINRDFKESSSDDQNKVKKLIFEPIFNEDTK